MLEIEVAPDGTLQNTDLVIQEKLVDHNGQFLKHPEKLEPSYDISCLPKVTISGSRFYSCSQYLQLPYQVK